jgi:hypothetical protein
LSPLTKELHYEKNHLIIIILILTIIEAQMMKRTLLGLLMILFTIITSCARTIMIIGDSICDTSINASGNIEETIYGRLKSYYEAKGYTVKLYVFKRCRTKAA